MYLVRVSSFEIGNSECVFEIARIPFDSESMSQALYVYDVKN